MSSPVGSSAVPVTRPVLFTARGVRRVRPDTVFARETDGGIQIIWRKYLPREDRILYTTTPSRFSFTIPDDFGFLPAPDGRRLVVWEVRHHPQTAEPAMTYWRMVCLDEGTVTELLETSGEPKHLPWWKTNEHVVLMGAQEEDTSLQELLRQYCRECFGKYYDLAHDSLPAWGEGIVGHEPVEYLLLRSLGVPSLGELRPWWPRILPHLAFSPDMKLVARTCAWAHLPYGLRYAADDGKVLPGTGARLDVFDTHTREHIWQKRVPYRLRRYIPSWELTTPPTFPWTSPTIGDLRWSPDNRYLAFTLYDYPFPSIAVLDVAARTGKSSDPQCKEVIQVQDALNAYVLPAPEKE